MATAAYTGSLTDMGVNVIPAGLSPRFTVRPEQAAFGPDGPLTDTRISIPVPTSASARFSVNLTPSTQLVPWRGGSPGVGYILELELLTGTGGEPFGWRTEWHFNALPGGGPIADMVNVPINPGPPYWELVTKAELDARVAGLVDELDLVTETALAEATEHMAEAYRCVHYEDGHPIWDARGGDAATHFVVHDPSIGRLIATTEAFPRPSTSLTDPYLDW